MSTRYSSIYTSLFLLDSTVQLASTLVSTHITWPHLALFLLFETTFERGRSSITRSVSSNGNYQAANCSATRICQAGQAAWGCSWASFDVGCHRKSQCWNMPTLLKCFPWSGYLVGYIMQVIENRTVHLLLYFTHSNGKNPDLNPGQVPVCNHYIYRIPVRLVVNPEKPPKKQQQPKMCLACCRKESSRLMMG